MNPLSKSKAKYIKSLQLKKQRIAEGCFLVEGVKSVLEFLASDFEVQMVVGTRQFLSDYTISLPEDRIFVAKAGDLDSLGNFKSNNAALAVVSMPNAVGPDIKPDEVVLALDRINDPGNLGTIIRIADWFGISKVLVSEESVDIFNPKVISATKGSLTRVKVIPCSLASVLAAYGGKVMAADMHGLPLADAAPLSAGVILMGSEAHGIHPRLDACITDRITIPRLGGAESLNVGVATGIVCYKLIDRRQGV